MAMFRRRYWSVALLAFVVAFLELGSGTGASAGEKKRFVIATVVKVDGIAWFERMRVGVENFSRQTGHAVIFTGPPQADSAQQVEVIENLIDRGVDAICLVPFSPKDCESALARARAAGIKVVVHEASTQRNCDIILEAFDNVEFGAKLAEIFGQRMGGKGEYVDFVGFKNSKTHNEWLEGGAKYLAEKYPDIHLLQPSRYEDHEDQELAYETFKAILKRFPRVKGVFGGGSTTAPGVSRAVEEAGRAGDIVIVGTSLPSICRDYIKRGVCDTIGFWDPALSGYAMNELALKLLKGEAVVDGADVGVEGYRNLRQDEKNPKLFYGSAWLFADKENVDQYAF